MRSLFASFCFARLLQYPCENFAFGRSAFGAFLLTPSSLGALGANFQINKKGGLLFYACGKVQSVVPKFAVYTLGGELELAVFRQSLGNVGKAPFFIHQVFLWPRKNVRFFRIFRRRRRKQTVNFKKHLSAKGLCGKWRQPST